MKSKIIFLLILLLFALSCKNRGSKSNKHLLEINNIDFHSFKTKAKVSYKDPNMSQKLKTSIRMRKDSIIWISATYMGFEAARMKILPDSVHMLLKLPTKEYHVFSFNKLEHMLNFKADFKTLQALLLGNQPIKEVGEQKLEKGKEYDILNQKINQFIIEHTVNKGTSKLEKLKISEENTTNTVNVQYSKFTTIDKHLTPTSVKIDVLYNDTTLLDPYESYISLNYYKSSFADSSLKYPFYVSKKYKRK